ncbi:MAG: F0F1 ATP synthase subunit alpha, partial [Alphaproteobacteria bacterium]|nr:F0F1 ATP synthase subunit alpha [Alphaproteobacteria bacterium]
QPQFSPLQVEEQVVVIYAGTKGYLDKLPVSAVGKFEEEFLRHMRSDGAELLKTIREEKSLSDASEKKLVETLNSFSSGFTA